MDPNISSKLDSIGKAITVSDLSDNVSVYIGYLLLGLGLLNSITDVPDAFIIGASIAGFCFTSSDLLLLHERYRKAIGPLSFIGVFSFFLLPIVLLSFPYHLLVLEVFSFVADMVTFFALGFVMIALGVRSRNAKVDFLKTSMEVVRHTFDEQVSTKSMVDDEMEKQARLIEKQMKMIEESHDRIATLEKELEEAKKKEQEKE